MNLNYGPLTFPIDTFSESVYDFPSLEGNVSDKEYNCNHFRNLWELSSDLHYLLRSSSMTNFMLRLNGSETIYCHKEILRNRSRWFRAQLEEAEKSGYVQIEISESRQILDAVLFYIYSGNLKHLELMDVPLLDLYQAAQKYGLDSLEKKLAIITRQKKAVELSKMVKFLWQIKVTDYRILNAECSAINGFSVCGTDSWELRIKPVPNDIQPRNGIFITRLTSGRSSEIVETKHTVFLQVSIIDGNGAITKTFSSQNTIEEDGECLLLKIFTHAEVAKSRSKIMPASVLRLSCELSVCAKAGHTEKFRLEDPYRNFLFSELTKLSDSMHSLLKFHKSHDFKFKPLPNCQITAHASIFFVRTRLPRYWLQAVAIKWRMGCVGWLSFLSFVYTGQVRFLADHGRDIYLNVTRYGFTEAKSKYSRYLSTNMNLENAFDLMLDAVECKDDDLLNAAAKFLAKKSSTITDHNVWIRLASDKVNLLSGYLHFRACTTQRPKR